MITESNEQEDWDRIYVSNLWAEDWDSPEDSADDGSEPE